LIEWHPIPPAGTEHQDIELARSSQRVSEQPWNPSVVELHPSKQTWFSTPIMAWSAAS